MKPTTKVLALLGLIFLLFECTPSETKPSENTVEPVTAQQIIPSLTLQQAESLIALPAKCIQQNLPYKSGLVISDPSDLQLPIVHHPAFYGCFDWHSAVHGHWVVVYLLKHFPEISDSERLMSMLQENMSAENIQTEIEYFELNKYSASFERTYGWAWLLKLSEELYTWDNAEAQTLYNNLKPLADLLVQKYIDYLPKLNYPIRVGEHTNTAFGLTFAFDYAKTTGATEILELITSRATDFYSTDQNCPILWEPSGYDFLSPCLQEAAIMQRILSSDEFNTWFAAFLPKLVSAEELIEPALVSDRSDGKLVHLDGLNFSRAWCLYDLSRNNSELAHLTKLADNHLAFSLPNIVDGDYAGEHWLASFALYALSRKSDQ